MKEIASSENIEKFVQNNCIYIDKTEYIYNLIKKRQIPSDKSEGLLVSII